MPHSLFSPTATSFDSLAPRSEPAPVARTLSMGSHQPCPSEVRYIHGPNYTVISRSWSGGDATSCRLCPRHLCTVTAGGMCLVQVPGRVPGELVELCPFDGKLPPRRG